MNHSIQLHQSENIKLRDYKDHDLVKITTQLIGLSSLLGLKELGAKESVLMADFITDQFKELTIEEVSEAFKMNVSGRLLDSKGEKTKPYGTLNVDYVGTVLALYRVYKSNELRKINKAAPIPMKTEEQKELELKTTMDEIFDELNTLFKQNILKYSVHNGVKYYGCLIYFNLLRPESDRELWNKAIEQEKLKYVGSFDTDSRKAVAYLMDSKGATKNDINKRVDISVKNRYKNLLASKCILELKDFYDDLNDVNE